MGQVLVFDGPAGPAHERGLESDYSPFRREPRVVVRHGQWDSDAAKRSAMVEWCRRFDKLFPTWGIWIDGDETLLWPELLPDYLRKTYELHDDAVAMSIKIVELDGSVADCGAKVIRLDLIDAILESSYQVKVRGMDTVMSLPNQPATSPPLPGEPHLLHRSMLRPAGRDEDRLHKREPDWFLEQAGKLGLPDEITTAEVGEGARA
jgi:hypothetical protein